MSDSVSQARHDLQRTIKDHRQTEFTFWRQRIEAGQAAPQQEARQEQQQPLAAERRLQP